MSEVSATARITAALTEVLQQDRDDPSLLVSDLAPFGDGHSGDTYAATVDSAAGREVLVLRLSPEGVPIKGPADVGRQGRLMASLAPYGVPVPHVLASSSGPDLAGRSYAVMQRVEGRDWSTFRSDAGDRATAAAAVAALLTVQAVPASASALADETWSLDPLDEVARWAPLMDRSPEDFQAPGAVLLEHLRGAAAGSAGVDVPVVVPVVVHGDYHYANLLFGERDVVAVLDWEIAGLGHPLTDLACLAVASMRRRYHPDPNPTGDVDVPLSHLADLHGCSADDLAWHVAASCFKYAAIIGYNLQLHRRGKKLDPIYESLTHTASRLLGDGAVILRDGLGDF